MSTDEMYLAVALVFARRIEQIFESEAALQTEFECHFPGLKFSRTEHWSGILYQVFRACWLEAGPEVKAEPTSFDRCTTLTHLHSLLDYNLFTQVLLNLQSYTGMSYWVGDVEQEVETLKAGWTDEKFNPFELKAKMVKEAKDDNEKRYNHVLSTLRSLNLISKFEPQTSFRVSPKGSTPAFADSRNLSMIGVGGDKYLRTLPSLRAYYLVWAPGSTPAMGYRKPPASVPGVSGGALTEFVAEYISYPFFSKSGGDILNEMLFARKIMYCVFATHNISQETCIMIPRLNSVLVIADRYGSNLKKAFEVLHQRYPMLELVEGARTLCG